MSTFGSAATALQLPKPWRPTHTKVRWSPGEGEWRRKKWRIRHKGSLQPPPPHMSVCACQSAAAIGKHAVLTTRILLPSVGHGVSSLQCLARLGEQLPRLGILQLLGQLLLHYSTDWLSKTFRNFRAFRNYFDGIAARYSTRAVGYRRRAKRARHTLGATVRRAQHGGVQKGSMFWPC